MKLLRALTVSAITLVVFSQFGCAEKEGAEGAPDAAQASRASLVALPSSAVVAAGTNQVTAYNPDGKQAWTFPLPNGDTVAAPPVAALSSLTYVRGVQGLYAVAPDGKLLWQAAHGGGGDMIKGVTPLGDSTVAVTAGDNSLVAYSAQGQPRWTFTLPDNDRLTALPALAPNSAVYLRGKTRLYAVDPKGNLSWQAELGAAE
jgi:hypothetical protein